MLLISLVSLDTSKLPCKCFEYNLLCNRSVVTVGVGVDRAGGGGDGWGI